MSDFKALKVWRKSHALSLNAHRTAVRIRGAEYVSLRSQIIRAAMSIPANIVEGNSQKSAREFARFVRFALNSTSELEYHLIVERDIRAIDATAFNSLVTQTVEVRKMLYGLVRYLETARQASAAANRRGVVTNN